MLFRDQNGKTRRKQKMSPIIFLPLLIAIVVAVSSCTAIKGSIVILESQMEQDLQWISGSGRKKQV